MHPTTQQHLIAFIRNCIGILLGFGLAFYLEHLLRWLAGEISGIAGSFTWKGVVFHATQQQWLDCNCVIITYLVGPLVLALVGVIIYRKFRELLRRQQKLRTIWFWFMLFAMVRLLGGFLAGWLTHQGLWFTLSWAYLPGFMQLGIGVLGAAGFLILSFQLRKYYLLNEQLTLQVLENGQYLLFVATHAIFPYGLISLLALAFQPVIGWHELIILAMGGLFLLPLLLGGKAMHRQQYLFDAGW